MAAAAFPLPVGPAVGVDQPLMLVALPVAILVLWYTILSRSGVGASTRSRRLLFTARVVVVALVVLGAAGPYTVVTTETPGEPRVTMLVDRSDSMSVLPDVADRLANDIEARGVPVSTVEVGSGTSSRQGDGIATTLRENGTVVVVSDGRVTEGRSLADAAELADSVNATIDAVALSPSRSERHVALNGPSKTSTGVENAFLARVEGVALEGSVELTVEIDGETVLTETVAEAGAVEFGHTFEETGTHQITARIDAADGIDDNDVYRKTVRVVEPPTILYVSDGDYPLKGYLQGLYDVETADAVPSNLAPYYAVVLQNAPADTAGDVSALQEFVIDGNGLLVVGGPNAFENGGYERSTLASMLPVTVGKAEGQRADIVLAIDISGSAEEGMRVQKAVALDVLDQLGDENRVGAVAFTSQAYGLAALQPLAGNRNSLATTIKRLQPRREGTQIATGLRGASEVLDGNPGTVILISDGRDRLETVLPAAERLRSEGTRVIAVGSGPNPNAENLRRIASVTGGEYYRADETARLRILFGGASRQYRGDGLTVVDGNHFITSGVRLESNPGRANDVSVRRGAELLVATAQGGPALATWRYGLGRVVTITTYAPDRTLGGLLSRPDSLAVTKATNYAVGDPERKTTGVTSAPDARVGEPTTIGYRGDEPPDGTGLRFRQVGEDRYEATITPTSQGYAEALDAGYAVNYPREYAAFGQSPALEAAVAATGGRTYAPSEGATIARQATDRARTTRDVEQRWDELLIGLGLLLFALEVLLRRLLVYRGRTRRESGLP